MKLRFVLLSSVFITGIIFSSANANAENLDAKKQIETYENIVLASYKDSLDTAKNLQKAVYAFLDNPNEENLEAAKKAWLEARNLYSQTEAYRFYDGPIDFVNQEKGLEGPEGKLNAWPLNEAYIDYVKGNPKSGIINDASVKIDANTIKVKNQAQDEADVSTGYHAIEFLLWGQDLSKDGPGDRPASDYAKSDPAKERRGQYLKVITDMLVSDLRFLVDSWEKNKDNYAKEFASDNPKKSLEKILTGMTTLSGFELASERMATALDSGDQEDEHSCFSDNTHNDFIYNARGIKNVYFGEYRNIKGAGIHKLVKAKDHALADKLAAQINETEKLIAQIPHPIDREVLASPKDSAGRKITEAAIKSLQKQAALLKQAGTELGLDVKIVTE